VCGDYGISQNPTPLKEIAMERTVQTKFYTYSQNNSGGSFDQNENIAEYVIIEATSAADADRRAEEVGIYFNGCATGSDCSCCGDRWNEAYGEGDTSPSIYGSPVGDEYVSKYGFSLRNSIIIHYYDGTKKTIPIVQVATTVTS
jgi:hypothetical protein